MSAHGKGNGGGGTGLSQAAPQMVKRGTRSVRRRHPYPAALAEEKVHPSATVRQCGFLKAPKASLELFLSASLLKRTHKQPDNGKDSCIFGLIHTSVKAHNLQLGLVS